MTILALLNALATVLAPILGVLVSQWATRMKETADDAATKARDTNILLVKDGNPTGLINLAHELERLQREAHRKSGHS